MTQDKLVKIAIGTSIAFIVICIVAVAARSAISSDTTEEVSDTTLEEVADNEGEDDSGKAQEESTSDEQDTTDVRTQSELLSDLSDSEAKHDWRELDLVDITKVLRGYSWLNSDTQTLLTIRYYRIDDYDLADGWRTQFTYQVKEAWLDRDTGMYLLSAYLGDYELSANIDTEVADLITIKISPAIGDEENTSNSVYKMEIEYGGDLEFSADTFYSTERTS